MEYLLSFLEGIITFVSPCLLPMIPLYISFFAGHDDNSSTPRTILRALCFVLGFTAVFTILGGVAGALGSLLTRYGTIVNIVCGALIILFGLSYMDVIRVPFLQRAGGVSYSGRFGALGAFVFGVVFSISWTPCISAFVGSALLLAASEGTMWQGVLMLLCYSIGIGIPFVLCAVLIERVGALFAWLKRHYKIINRVCGALLVVIGLLMITGLWSRFLGLFS